MAVIKHPSAGGGDWADDLGTGAEIDGVVSLKSQSSAPSATADYGKLYATNDDDGSTVLLCHFEGSDAATSGDGFLDSSSTSVHTVAAVGNAQIDTDQFKWGASSMLFDGTGDYLTVSDSTDFDWDAAFTIEFWFRLAVESGAQAISYSATDNTSFHRIIWDGDNNRFDVGLMDGSFTAADTLSVDTWYHLAVTRDGSNVVRIYRDGVAKGTMTKAGTVANTGGLTIGAYSHLTTAGNDPFNGWIDEYRIKKGVALYTGTGSFTPPTAALIGTSTEMYVIDAAGNETKISPHNPKTGEWEYYSKNTKTGKTVRINMEEAIRDLGQLTGKDYIKHE